MLSARGAKLGLGLLAATALLAVMPGAAQAGNFRRMFPTLSRFTFSNQAAHDLAATMLNRNPDPPGVNNGRPDDSTGLAAWQTYFGQFLDHNLDFDNTPQPTAPVNVSTLKNQSAGVFDLSNLFGGGPQHEPQLYNPDGTLKLDCKLGTPFADGFPDVLSGNANGACDTARNADGTAIVHDQRDDENQIISQMDVAWALFYNHFIAQGMSQTQAQKTTVGYYQLEIFDQMLPDFVTNPAYIALYAKQTGTHTWKITTPDDLDANFMPIEFALGAYRFGHSLVRNTYTVNDITDSPQVLNNVPIFDVNHFQVGDLSGGAPLQGTVQKPAPGCQAPDQSMLLCQTPSDHQIEWKYFFKSLNLKGLDGGITNQARQTNTTISPNLFNLPAETIPGCENAPTDPACKGSNSLIARDFARAQYDGMVSGQEAANHLKCPVISAASLNPTNDAVFDKGTPLLYYVLAEAKRANAVLGCVGSKIIAQVFLRALAGAQSSNSKGTTLTTITPDPALNPVGAAGQFTFQDLLIDDGLTPALS